MLQPKIIACENVVKEILSLLPEGMSYTIVESGLHKKPDQLKVYLQEQIDEADGLFDPIILGFGQCSNAVIGLAAHKSRLVIPRVDDCIAMVLGSSSAYKEILKKVPGTYFLSRGWVESGMTLVEEFKEFRKKYGKDKADRVQKKMLNHYTRLVFVDTGEADLEWCKEDSRKSALALNLNFEVVQGNKDLIYAMVNGPHDDQFIVAQTDHQITLKDFSSPDTNKTFVNEEE
jgi:hypothetical protein